MPFVFGVLAAAMVAVCSKVIIATAKSAVDPQRFGQFITRQRLTIRHEELMKHAEVHRYLAITRRWRVAGCVVALCFGTAAGFRRHAITLDATAMFVGWFVGAIVAEWRLRTRPEAPLRRASLVPRRIGAYLSVPRLLLPCLVTGTAMAVGGLNLRFGQVPRGVTLALIALVVIPAGAAFIAARYVVSRPRASVDAQAQIIDSALRSRSLHALSGAVVGNGTVALAALCYVSPVVTPGSAWLVPLGVLVAGFAATWWIAVWPVSGRLAVVTAGVAA